VGSLPYDDVDAALDYSLRHDIPFLPEIKGDKMLIYIQKPGSNRCLREFKRRVKGADLVKVQCVGPITVVADQSLKYTDEHAITNCSYHIYEIYNGLDVKKSILVLDAPGLGEVDRSRYEAIWGRFLEDLGTVVDMENITLGVHICGKMTWGNLAEVPYIDIISFDASTQADKLMLEYEKIRANKKRIAWGITKKENVRAFQDGDLITLPCGIPFGSYDIEHAEKSLEMLIATKEEILS